MTETNDTAVLRAVKFTSQAGQLRAFHAELPVASPATLSSLQDHKLPVVYVLCTDDFEAFRDGAFKSVIENRGEQDAKKQLHRLLLRREHIQLIAAKFAVHGRLVGAVDTLLRAALAANEANVYLVGVQRALFTETWQAAVPVNPFTKRADPTTEWEKLFHRLRNVEPPPKLRSVFVGVSDRAELVRKLIVCAAADDKTVLILGPTGSGKEIVAHEIHNLAARGASRPFISVNCAAISTELFESAFFGHTQGSFTGAVSDRTGYWVSAQHGTLFLDEIGLMPLDNQGKLLRAIETREVTPLGESKPIPVNARLMAATNRNLEELVAAGKFLEDLYYRLRQIIVHTPSLDEHPEDIGVLADHFWYKLTPNDTHLPRALPADVIAELMKFRWPGNAREINCVLTQMRTYALKDQNPVDADLFYRALYRQDPRPLVPSRLPRY